jgi:glycosyltransferase involved in cell wall biosynthesis
MPLHSICVTCRNNVSTVRASLESIIDQIDELFEIIIVDSKSDDGTTEILKEYADKGLIKLIVEKCSRGRGRQIAFQNSEGKHVIANMDLDDIFMPKLKALLDFYHKRCEGKILLAIKGTSKKLRGLQNTTIGDRDIIEKLGGWRNLQWAEDWDLWSRAAKKGLYVWTVFPFVKKVSLHTERKRIITRFLFRYVKYMELLRLGRPVFSHNEKVTLSQKLTLFLAKVSALTKEKYHDEFNKIFDSYDRRYYIEFRLVLRRLFIHLQEL